ncbi:MAG: PEP-CTERM sorting domain-containing protein [Kiritimatiellae bacterium]|nr:PEP-CTERM sorting domain-containing protein [Kiritimatiellia bacterium]
MKKLLVFLFVLVAASISFADVIAAWEVTGVNVGSGTGIDEAVSPYRFSATSKDANMGTAQLSLGFDGPSTATDMYGFRFSAATHQTSLADAISNNHYIQWSLTAASGYALNLTSLEMNGQSGSSGPADIVLMTSVDGFSEGDEIGSLTARQNVTGGWDTDSSGWGAPIDLSAAGYQGLSTVSFRIYGWNSSGTASAGIRNMTGNDLIINGTMAAIPEPATLGFMGIGLTALFLARRRMKK